MVIEVQENNSISDNCVNNDERINVHPTQTFQLMLLRYTDLRICYNLGDLPEHLILQCLILSG